MFTSLPSSLVEGAVPLAPHTRFGSWEREGRRGTPAPSRFRLFHCTRFVFLLSVVSRKARAVYPCEAEHSSELSFEIGAIFEDGKCSWELCSRMYVVCSPEHTVTGCSVIGVTSLCLTPRAGESWPVCPSGTGCRGAAPWRLAYPFLSRGCSPAVLTLAGLHSGYLSPDIKKLVTFGVKK